MSAGDVDRALEVAKRMRTGKVTINGRSHFGITSPFGGTKQSGLGYRNGGFATIPMSMHYITNIESDIRGDTARVRAMFYNPMQLPGLSELSYCGGCYHHDLVRTADGWRRSHLREENVWSSIRRPAPGHTPLVLSA
jgi:SnoaL-like domain/Aldehyde dehydrogenase family